MSGLLIKDWKLLKNQGRDFLISLIVFVVMLMIGSREYATFATSYITFLMSYLTLSTISYDEFDKGMGFLMVLPISRRIYVTEKYVLAFFLTVTAWIFSVAMNMFLFAFGATRQEWIEMMTVEPVYFMVVILFVSLSLPFYMKFGPEKGRMAAFGVIGICMAAIILMTRLGVRISLPGFLHRILEQPAAISAVCIGISALVMGISWLISLSIMEKREF